MTKQFAGSEVAWVAGDDDIGIVVRATAADFNFDIGDVNPAGIRLNLWLEGTIEVEGNIIVGDAAPGHGNHCAVDIFVAEFLEWFPCQIFGDRHGWELGSGNHGEVPQGN